MSKVSENKLSKLFEKFSSNKKIRYVIVAILFLIVLFIAFGNIKTKENNVNEDFSIDKYVSNLESKLTKTLSKVKGAGKVEVVITIDSGMETVLASKTTITEKNGVKETVETPIIISGKPVVLKEIYPEIVGVLIVSQGASNISVMNRLQQATVSLLDININQIEILTMN